MFIMTYQNTISWIMPIFSKLWESVSEYVWGKNYYKSTN